MPQSGEIADILTKKQHDFILKQALSDQAKKGKKSGTGNRSTPLNPELGQRRAGRDKTGKISIPGGGAPHQVPTPEEARDILKLFYNKGGKYNSLPDQSNTKEAKRNKGRRPTVKNDKVVAPARRPDGTATVQGKKVRWGYDEKGEIRSYTADEWMAMQKQQLSKVQKPKAVDKSTPAKTKTIPITPFKKFATAPRKKTQKESLNYTSKHISEEFLNNLDNVLGE